MEVTSATKSLPVTIANGTAISEQAIPMMDFIGGFVIVPAEWTDANIGFKVASLQSGTPVIACDDTGAPIQISGVTTNASKAYRIPAALFAAHHVWIWSKSTTAATITDTNQGAARSLTVILK